MIMSMAGCGKENMNTSNTTNTVNTKKSEHDITGAVSVNTATELKIRQNGIRICLLWRISRVENSYSIMER